MVSLQLNLYFSEVRVWNARNNVWAKNYLRQALEVSEKLKIFSIIRNRKSESCFVWLNLELEHYFQQETCEMNDSFEFSTIQVILRVDDYFQENFRRYVLSVLVHQCARKKCVHNFVFNQLKKVVIISAFFSNILAQMKDI